MEITGKTPEFYGTEVVVPSELNVALYEGAPLTRSVVTRIAKRAFSFSKLESIEMPISITEIGEGAFSNSHIQNIKFSDNIVYIGDYAFDNTRYLNSVKFPESLLILGMKCFQYSFIKEIYLPSTLRSLGGFTFMNCSFLRDIYCPSEVPPVAQDNDFGVLNVSSEDIESVNFEECILHVPAGSEEIYRNAPGWRLFKNVIAIDDNSIAYKDMIEEDKIEDSVSNISYEVSNGKVSVRCNAGDKISIYDINGTCLDTQVFSNSQEYIHYGHGLRCVTINDTTIKILL